jgi:hypothetical protein
MNGCGEIPSADLAGTLPDPTSSVDGREAALPDGWVRIVNALPETDSNMPACTIPRARGCR